MTDQNVHQLLNGPYKPPRVKVGEQLACAMRGEVTVGVFSEGPIVWPCIRTGGHPAFILCADLERAVRSESCASVAHGWGVARQTVIRWRKALGVSRVHRGGRYYPAELISLNGQTPFAIKSRQAPAAHGSAASRRGTAARATLAAAARKTTKSAERKNSAGKSRPAKTKR